VVAKKGAERGRTLLRKLDRCLGVPLLMLIGLLRPKRPKPATIGSLGICVFAAIGDALLASVLIQELKKEYPQLKITIFATSANAEVFKLIRGWDDLVLVPITQPWAAIRQVRAHPVDALIDTSQWPRIGALVCALSGAKWTLGFKTTGQDRHFAYDCVVDHSPKIHELDNFRALLAPFGLKSVSIPQIDLRALEGINCLNIKQPYLVFHPWASGNHFELREWPLQSWLELANRALKAGYGLLITGGPADVVRADNLMAAIAQSHPESLAQGVLTSLAGKVDLVSTAAHLQKSAGVVSVNTGTMHLAALLGVPLAALHGPTDPNRWGPIYPRSTSGQTPEQSPELSPIILGPGRNEGGAYLNLGFEYPENPAYLMNQIAVQDVVEALRKFSINIH
jgi:ADP-heptose:LPS heptosyltransferase